MSLGVVIKGTEGIVLAAESRVSLNREERRGNTIIIERQDLDHATKLLTFTGENRNIGVVTYGTAILGDVNNPRTAKSFIPEFEDSLPPGRLSIGEFAKCLSEFFIKQWEEFIPPNYQGQPMSFVVGGFDQDEAYGKVFLFVIPHQPKPEEKNPGKFGITWGGQGKFIHRIIMGYDPQVLEVVKDVIQPTSQKIQTLQQKLHQTVHLPMIYSFLPLQDCVDFAIFLIKTTIEAQRLSLEVAGCGGAVDVATITREDGLKFVQRKEIKGERT